MSIDYMIAKYGLLAVLLGIIVQGETIVFIGGIFAHRGDIDFAMLLTVAVLGNMVSDNLFFNLGRYFGAPILKIFPAVQRRVGRIKTLFNRHPFLIVLFFRFMVGFRITAPCVIGMTGYKRIKFFLMDIASSFLWACSYASLGYFFGKMIDHLLDDAGKHELWIAAVIGVIGFGGVFLHHHHHVKRRRKAMARLQRMKS